MRFSTTAIDRFPMPTFRSPVVHHLAPWAIAAVAALLLAWGPTVFAAGSAPPSVPVPFAPVVPVPAPASPVVARVPTVDQADLTARRNTMTQGMIGQYDRGVARTAEVLGPLQDKLLAQFATARKALDTARIQVTSGDVQQRLNAGHAVDNTRQLLTTSHQQVQWAVDNLHQETRIAIDASNGTVRAAQMMDQSLVAPNANTLASQSAFHASKQRLDGLPAFVNSHAQAFRTTVEAQQKDLQQRVDAIAALMTTTHVH